MSNRFAALLAACALALAASGALAQSAPAQKPGGSTAVPSVTVEAPPPKVIERQSFDFVQGVTKPSNPEVDAIGRWHDAVCVAVLGLAETEAAKIKTRIQEVAAEVGLPAAKPACSANVEIFFSDRPQLVMDKVAKQRGQLLGYYHVHDRAALKQVTRPIQAWYVTATRGRGGTNVVPFLGTSDPFDTGLPGLQTSPRVVDDPENIPPAGCGDNPHFTACLSSEFANVFVVADAKALQGKDLAFLSDYLAMLALSQPRSLDGCAALASVIDALAPSDCGGRLAPDGFTPADAAYLTSLYSADPEGKRVAQQTEISTRMARILTKGLNVRR
jgi:hypothetical protein